MFDGQPPLLPETPLWAIVTKDQIGDPRPGLKPGTTVRTIRRSDGSSIEVVYPTKVDEKPDPVLVIVELVNVLVMRGDLRVLDPQAEGPVDLHIT